MSEVAGGCLGLWPELILLPPGHCGITFPNIANYNKYVMMQSTSFVGKVVKLRSDEVNSADTQLLCGDRAVVKRVQFEGIQSNCTRAEIEILKTHIYAWPHL